MPMSLKRDALTPKPAVKVEGEDPRKDSRMLKDERVRAEAERSIFDVKDAPNRLG
ncbi:zinc finger protein [Trichophyton tonsurans CBS 112818]|uniref:Zinc finger protein n=1 Tax=Trichophyton tonsurans (strain CBS 112818) TaxID=647933 RepID=F2S7J3_TRIT1|nr:zinc finger protein [Trichophyton tonsurans CBS 112818]